MEEVPKSCLPALDGRYRIAIRGDRSIDEQARQLAARVRLAGGLWKQTQDHRARLGAIREKLDEGDPRAVADLLGHSGDGLDKAYSAVATRIENRLVASLLIGEAGVAHERGIELELDSRSRFRRLPDHLDETEAVSIIGNLLQNAFDAVAGLPRKRRRVTVLLSDASNRMRVRVRDWGFGLGGSSDEELLSHGFTTKAGHSGVGLAMVRDLARATGGTLTIERLRVGTAFDVKIPDG